MSLYDFTDICIKLTGIVTPYGVNELGQTWSLAYQAITFTNIVFAPVSSSDIDLKSYPSLQVILGSRVDCEITITILLRKLILLQQRF